MGQINIPLSDIPPNVIHEAWWVLSENHSKYKTEEQKDAEKTAKRLGDLRLKIQYKVMKFDQKVSYFHRNKKFCL